MPISSKNLENNFYPLWRISLDYLNSNDFIIKYFNAIDLSEAIIKYIFILVVNSQKKQSKNIIKKLSKPSKYTEYINKEAKNSFIKQLTSIGENKYWKKLCLIRDEYKIEINNVDFKPKQHYKNNSNRLYKLLIDFMSSLEINNYFNLILPIKKIANEKYQCIKLNGKELSVNEFHFKNISLNEIYLLEIKTNQFFKIEYLENKLPENKSEITINTFFRLFYKKISLKLEISKKENINKTLKPIKREYIGNIIDKFINSKNSGHFVIKAPYGAGKTYSLKRYIAKNNLFDFYYYDVSEKKIEAIIEKIILDQDLLNQTNKMEKYDFNTLFQNINTNSQKKKVIIFENIDSIINSWELINLLPAKLPDNIYFIFTLSRLSILTSLNEKTVYNLPKLLSSEIEEIKKLNNMPKKEAEFNYAKTNMTEQNFNFYPLYLKIDYLRSKDLNEFKTQINQLEKQFIKELENTINKERKYEPYKKDLKNILGIMSICKIGLTFSDLQNISPNLPPYIIDNFFDSLSNFIEFWDRKYYFASNYLKQIYQNKYLKEEKEYHSKIINFLEPWNKKVSSFALQYLPYHYFKAERYKDLEHLLSTNFLKSKIKLYPDESLNDIKQYIIYLINSPNNKIVEIIKYTKIYSNFKDQIKENLSNSFELCKSGPTKQLKNRISQIDLEENKYLQLMVLTNYFSKVNPKNKNPFVDYLKDFNSINNIEFIKQNSEIIFKTHAEVLSKGDFSIMDLTFTTNDNNNLIKYLPENDHLYKFIKLTFKSIDLVKTELEKAVIIESIITKVFRLKNIYFVDKFSNRLFKMIKELGSDDLREKLYIIFISNVIAKPVIIDKFLAKFILLKDSFKNKLYQSLFYGNIALIYNLFNNQEKAKEYIFKTLDLVGPVEETQKEYIFSKLLFSIPSFKHNDYFPDLLDRLINCIKENFNNKLQINYIIRSVELLDLYNSPLKLLKELQTQIYKESYRDFINVLPDYLSAVDRISDGRRKTPIIKKLKKYSEEQSLEKKIVLLTHLVFHVDYKKSKDDWEFIINQFNDFSGNKFKLMSNLFNVNKKNKAKYFIKELINFNFDYALQINDDLNKYHLIEKGFGLINLAKIPDIEISLQIMNSIKDLKNSENKLKLNFYLSAILTILNQERQSLNLLHNCFSELSKKDDFLKFELIKYLMPKIINLNNKKYIQDAVVLIIGTLRDINEEKFILKSLNIFLKNIVSIKIITFNFKNVFERIFELKEKFRTAKSKNSFIKLLFKYLYKIENNLDLLKIIQKIIIISESNFSRNENNLLSKINLPIDSKFKNNLNYQKIVKETIEKLNFINSEDYISETINEIIPIVLSFKDNKFIKDTFEQILLNDFLHLSDRFLINHYSLLANQITKISQEDIIFNLFKLLVSNSLKIKNEIVLADLLGKYAIAITNLKHSSEIEDFFAEILSISDQFKNNFVLVKFYKSLIIAMDKLNTKKIIGFLKKLDGTVNRKLQNKLAIIEVNSVISNFYYKYSEKKKSKEIIEKIVVMANTLGDSPNEIEILSNLMFRFFLLKEEYSAISFMNYLKSILMNKENELEKYNNVSILITKIKEFKNLKKNKQTIIDFLNEISKFENINYQFNINIVLGNTFFNLNENEISREYFSQAEKNIIKMGNEIENLNKKFYLASVMIKCKNNQGNKIFKDFVKNNNLLNESTLDNYVKILSLIVNLNSLSIESNIIEKIFNYFESYKLTNIKSNDLKLIAEFTLKFNKKETFFEILSLVNFIDLNKLINQALRKFDKKDEIQSLKNLLEYSLDNSILLDKNISLIIKKIKDPVKTNSIISFFN